MAHIGPVAAVLDDNRPAFVRVFTENLAGVGAKAAALFRIGFLLGDQRDRAIEADSHDIVAILEVRVGLAVLDVSTEAAKAGNCRLAVVADPPDLGPPRRATNA